MNNRIIYVRTNVGDSDDGDDDDASTQHGHHSLHTQQMQEWESLRTRKLNPVINSAAASSPSANQKFDNPQRLGTPVINSNCNAENTPFATKEIRYIRLQLAFRKNHL